MYHPVYPPQMMVQVMNSQQANDQCARIQTHAHFNAVNSLPQNDYIQYMSDVSGHNKHRMLQAGSYPVELLQLMGVDIPSIRRANYAQGTSSLLAENWPKRMGLSSGISNHQSPSHLNYRPNVNAGGKKQPWNNKSTKRGSHRNSYSRNESYNSDSGISSRSPTPNKHQTDSSQTESSDERDSVGSSIETNNKKLNDAYSVSKSANNNYPYVGLLPGTGGNQYYQHHIPLNYYHSPFVPIRSFPQNYQNKRRYHSGRNSPPPQRNQRGRKYIEAVTLPTYAMFQRYPIAPDRFLAKSHMIQVTQTPKYLTNGTIYDSLSQQIWAKFVANQQTENTYRNKMMLWKYLYVYIKTLFPKYGLFLVGSTMNGFGSDNSDVDMCLLVRYSEMDQRNEAIIHLEQISKCLKRCEFIDELKLIQAKIPILKFRDSIKNLEVDLNCNNSVGIRNTHLLYCYSRIDWRVRPLVLVVKLWAQSQDINDAKNMTISSYSLVLMVIHFLQCGASQPVLPCLHYLYTNKFAPHTEIHTIDILEELNVPPDVFPRLNKQSIGELLVDFFKYYTTFDFSRYAISVRVANKIPIEECRRARTYKNDPHQWKYLCVEEPFDLTNTARSVYDPNVFARIKHVFDVTYHKLTKSHDLPTIFTKVNTLPSFSAT